MSDLGPGCEDGMREEEMSRIPMGVDARHRVYLVAIDSQPIETQIR